MTSRLAKEPQEKDLTRGRLEDWRREHVDRMTDQRLGALGKYHNNREADRRLRPFPHRDITPLDVSMEEILMAV